ncbi:MAG: MazG nucleotide pyrophosphohydrolase domain-containing protein [Candidatus Hydrogenedentales bacterium]
MTATIAMRDAPNRSDSDSCTQPDAILEAHELHEKASAAGFDWTEVAGVLAKVREELDELHAALDAGDEQHARRELGDLLFSAINLARFLRADPSFELRRASARFAARFGALQAEATRRGMNMQECTLEQLDVIWEEIKVKRGGKE